MPSVGPLGRASRTTYSSSPSASRSLATQDGVPSEGLGGLRLGVSPLEMASAYATLASEALDTVRAAVLDASGYTARFTHFPVVGLCPACASDEG